MGVLQPVMARRFLAASVVRLLLNVAPLEHFAWISQQQKSDVPSPFRRPVSRPDFCDRKEVKLLVLSGLPASLKSPKDEKIESFTKLRRGSECRVLLLCSIDVNCAIPFR
jgi:hypothetical protein